VFRLTVAALALFATPSMRADIVVGHQGEPSSFVSNDQGAEDAELFSANSNDDYGGPGTLVGDASGCRHLFRFDLSALAGRDSQIDAISLSLHLNFITPSSTTGDLSWYAVNPVNAELGTRKQGSYAGGP
jgi:hypothetical protein